jgi:hypothetical protein
MLWCLWQFQGLTFGSGFRQAHAPAAGQLDNWPAVALQRVDQAASD